MGRFAAITPDTSFERRVREAVQGLPPGEVVRWRDEYVRIDPTKVAAELARDGVEVACIGPDLAIETAIQMAEAFDREAPDICVIVVADATAELYRAALRAGVRDVVAPSGDLAELSAAIDRALETARRRNAAADREPQAQRSSRVITVLSPKGGAGKTTVATNLSVGLAVNMPGQVAIVDLDVQFGDIAAALQLTPEQGLGDIAASADPVTTTMVKVFLAHHQSGLYALCAPDSPAEGDAVSFEHTAAAIRLLAEEFSVVVVDTGAGLHDHALAAIELSTDLLLVCTTDVASVRSLRKELDALDRLGMTTQRRHFVLNRSDARVGLDMADIEEVVGMKATLALPSSRAIPVSMNLGSPVMESDPRSNVARQLQKLVEQFSDVIPANKPAPAASPSRLWRRESR